MKRILPLILLAASCLAQTVTLRWAAELGDARPARFTLIRGDTVELAADLFAEGRPYAPAAADASLLWQTNGMDALWWEVPAFVASNRVSATWTPAMDCGAASYLVHFRVGSSTGSVFRAYARLAMQHGPGDPVNALPLPVPVLDFDKIVVTNAPWGEGGGTDGQAVTNIVEGIVRDATNALPRGVTIDVQGVGETFSYKLTSSPTIYWEDDTDGAKPVLDTLIAAEQLHDEGLLNAEDLAAVALSGSYDDLSGTPSLGTAAYRDASEFATAADEALVYQLLMGSNVVAEVTNYNSRVRAPQFRLLQLDPDTKEYFTVWAETNGLSRTLNEAKAHTDAATNALGLAKADRAWSHHTSGLGADAPAGVTWISTPETVVAGGYEYAKHVTTHGEVWVLTSNGLGLGADTNAYFCVKAGDGETLFSIEKTDSILVGVDADGISVSGGVVTIPLGVVSQDPPVCYAANSLVNAAWADLSEVGLPAWVESATVSGQPGAWVWRIETTAPSAFFQFRVLQPGATVIRNNAQTDISAGILINGTRFYPHVSGGTLTWTTTP